MCDDPPPVPITITELLELLAAQMASSNKVFSVPRSEKWANAVMMRALWDSEFAKNLTRLYTLAYSEVFVPMEEAESLSHGIMTTLFSPIGFALPGMDGEGALPKGILPSFLETPLGYVVNRARRRAYVDDDTYPIPTSVTMIGIPPAKLTHEIYLGRICPLIINGQLVLPATIVHRLCRLFDTRIVR